MIGFVYNLLFILSDIDKPKLNTTSGTVTANEGSFLSISCNASANPKVHYMWTQNGTMVSNSSILSFSNINRSQANAYTCIASNGAGLQSRASVQIDVQCKFFLLTDGTNIFLVNYKWS